MLCKSAYITIMINKNIFKSCLCRNVASYVPQHQPATESDILQLKNFLLSYKNIVVLTGAGISTESGIPDYRSKDVGLYARSNHKPITYQEFMKDQKARKRYWCRSFAGWPQFSSVTPNLTHIILRKLEDTGFVSCIVTQNVDNLHFKIGSKNVIELHGTLYRVICTNCRDYIIDRYAYQKILQKLNPAFKKTTEILRPDGDVELTEEDMYSFNITNCPKCSGFLKPDVVFFGENVPSKRIYQVKYEIDNCTSLLILGSSLSVYSSFRIVLQAAELKKPVCIVNIGETRGDNLATLKINAKCGEILSAVSSLI